jgi:gluconokinase
MDFPFMKTTPTIIPGVRSPYEKVGGVYHFGRMLDKIRVHRERRLPEDWVAAMGSPKGFDGRCCRFLKISYPALQAETLKGGSDDQLIAWAFANGYRPSDEEIEIWNGFLSKLGWRDSHLERLHFRLTEVGLPTGSVLTMFDFIDLDEGRPPRFP